MHPVSKFSMYEPSVRVFGNVALIFIRTSFCISCRGEISLLRPYRYICRPILSADMEVKDIIGYLENIADIFLSGTANDTLFAIHS